jgi:hypothetical protein
VSAPSGLRVVDTRTWTVRTVDSGASYFAVADGVVLAFGWTWSSETNVRTELGVAAYTREGELRFHAFGDEPVNAVQVAGGYAYVTRIPSTGPAVLELTSGRVVAMLDRATAYLLVPGQIPY